jgi:hypothetical protein
MAKFTGVLDLLTKVKPFVESLERTKRVYKEGEEEKVLRLAIKQLAHIEALYNKNYDQLRTRIITTIGAAFALLGYLYRDPGNWFLPENVYGQVMYGAGWLLILTAFVCLFRGMYAVTWYYPMELKSLKKLKFDTEKDLLIEVKEEYLETIENNIIPYEKKQSLYKIALYTLIPGGILLMVINQLVNRGVL